MPKMIRCKKCGKIYYSAMCKCPECLTPRPKDFKKPLLIGLLCFSLFAVVAIIGFLFGEDTESIKTNQSYADSQNTISDEEKFIDYIEWADLNNYCFAVECSDYNGDAVQAGTYRFYPDLVNGIDEGRIPIVWDIYVSNNLYSNISQLKEEEYIGTVGGVTQDELTKTLNKGQYVYIKYNKVANDKPTGILSIKKIQ